MVVRANFRMTTGHSKSLDVRGTAEMNLAGPGSGDGVVVQPYGLAEAADLTPFAHPF